MAKRYRVGFALASKKVGSFLQPSLIDHAAGRGLDLVHVDPSKPLSEQGPLDCLIHKFYHDDWKLQLQSFAAQNPNSPIVDPIDAVEKLHNRVSMLQVVADLKLDPNRPERLDIPRQVVVSDGSKPTQALVKELGFPLIAKPLLANGSILSHKMCLIFDGEGLKEVEGTPIVLQEFVNHGGVIFKVYVAGNHVQCVKRKSLPDISEEKLKSLKGTMPFAQVSNLADGGDGHGGSEFADVEMPPEGFVGEVGRGLKEGMGLNLFNFDMIRDARDGNRYLVIDINYFPGYAKMPNYESVLTDFILELLHQKGE
ncbi:Inositol-tetrakisphosphate 1-kinase 1 [Linum grandiflorum]